MGKHGARGGPPGIGEDVAEVTLPRVADALRGLGFEPLERPDRVVVPAYSHIASFWVSHEKPLMLVGDCQQRIPVDFEYGTALARFLNTWNHDRVGPTASYRLADSGDIDVHLRSGIRIKYGLSDEQLLQELADALEHMASFSLQLRERFLPAGFDHPLPPTLSRAQDAEALLGRHPCERHLPRGGELDVGDVPDLYSPFDRAAGAGVCRQVGIPEFEDAFDTLDFAYALTPEEVIATGVNGVPFAVCIDGEAYARVTSMWDSGRDPRSGFLPLWLMCNSVNEKSEGLRAYLHEMDDHLHVHVETTCLISAGLTPHQLDNYVLTSLVAVLGAVDAISTQSQGATVVNWPSAGQ
ncbi:YbjN domain-containing protein [uncultured Corynebacterium sp.]|uniref:YbjN domain-containing protein n=1 Tax=uncultured Corynebacterium sp. TaxID=159447 RepID=UPI0025928B4F|nr:YbjN domain-containing protein [uncultured Corynebacterium sp.]